VTHATNDQAREHVYVDMFREKMCHKNRLNVYVSCDSLSERDAMKHIYIYFVYVFFNLVCKNIVFVVYTYCTE